MNWIFYIVMLNNEKVDMKLADIQTVIGLRQALRTRKNIDVTKAWNWWLFFDLTVIFDSNVYSVYIELLHSKETLGNVTKQKLLYNSVELEVVF
jgi:hypothetical protein